MLTKNRYYVVAPNRRGLVQPVPRQPTDGYRTLVEAQRKQNTLRGRNRTQSNILHRDSRGRQVIYRNPSTEDHR
jgi:hypothetical protein